MGFLESKVGEVTQGFQALLILDLKAYKVHWAMQVLHINVMVVKLLNIFKKVIFVFTNSVFAECIV